MSENEQMDLDTSFSFVLKGKKISFSDESTPGYLRILYFRNIISK